MARKIYELNNICYDQYRIVWNLVFKLQNQIKPLLSALSITFENDCIIEMKANTVKPE